MITLAYRAIGAALLDSATYEDVEADRSATIQALTIVLISSLAAGIGAAPQDGPRVITIVSISAVALATWLAWARLILHVGGRMFPEQQTRVDFGQLVRTIGFAAAPGAMQAMGLLTSIRTPVFVVSWLWMLAAMIVAVRQALDYRSIWHAVSVCIIALGVIAATALVLGVGLARIVD